MAVVDIPGMMQTDDQSHSRVQTDDQTHFRVLADHHYHSGLEAFLHAALLHAALLLWTSFVVLILLFLSTLLTACHYSLHGRDENEREDGRQSLRFLKQRENIICLESRSS